MKTLKSESVKFGVKHGHMAPIGEANKEQIFEIINEKGPISVKGIKSEYSDKNRGRNISTISERTIHTHLNELIIQRRVYKNEEKGKRSTYIVLDLDLGYVTTFAKNIKDALGFMISPHLLKSDLPSSSEDIDQLYLPKIHLAPSSFMDNSIYKNFCRRVAGISVSSKLISKVKITKDNINSILFFEFANRIGAYITYLLIESMRPVNFNMKESNEELQLFRRSILSERLLQIAINIQQMFEIFHNLLYRTYQIKKQYPRTTSRKPLFFEMEKEEYDKLSNTFKKVYPGIYEGLEKYWQDMTRLWLTNQIRLKQNSTGKKTEEYFTGKKIDCNHKWNAVTIFKLEGDYYHCRKCNNVVDGFYYNELTKQTKLK